MDTELQSASGGCWEVKKWARRCARRGKDLTTRAAVEQASHHAGAGGGVAVYSTTVRIRHGSISVDFSFEAQAIRRVCGGLQTVDRQRGGRSMRGCQERVVCGEGGRDMFSVTCRTVGLTKNAVGF